MVVSFVAVLFTGVVVDTAVAVLVIVPDVKLGSTVAENVILTTAPGARKSILHDIAGGVIGGGQDIEAFPVTIVGVGPAVMAVSCGGNVSVTCRPKISTVPIFVRVST